MTDHQWRLFMRIKIPAIPVGQPRARAASIRGRARVYEPKYVGTGHDRRPHPAAEYKATVRQAVHDLYDGPPLDEPLRVDLIFVFPRPASMVWKTKPMPRAPHTKKPDRDNLDKSTLDALTGLLWRDDCQVCAGFIEKWIAAGDEQPHVEMRVYMLTGEDE